MNPSNYSSISFPFLGLEVNPPRSLSLGPLNIYLYGVAIALGLILAVVYVCRRSKEFVGLSDDDILDGVLWITPFAIVCARLYYVAFSWESYRDNPISILYIWEGGIAIYGSVLGAIAGMAVYCKIKKVRLTALLDLVLMAFLIGQILGRWGNFFNREAFGAETDIFIRMGLFQNADGSYSNVMHYFHPTFLYESLWNAAGFVLLHFLSKKRQYDGQIALGYVLWYGLGRTFIEGLRTDSLMWGDFRVSQILAGVTAIAAAVTLFVLSTRRHDPEKLFVNQVAAMEQAEEEPETAEEETEEPEKD